MINLPQWFLMSLPILRCAWRGYLQCEVSVVQRRFAGGSWGQCFATTLQFKVCDNKVSLAQVSEEVVARLGSEFAPETMSSVPRCDKVLWSAVVCGLGLESTVRGSSSERPYRDNMVKTIYEATRLLEVTLC